MGPEHERHGCARTRSAGVVSLHAGWTKGQDSKNRTRRLQVMIEVIIFSALAAMVIIPALMVVTLKNVFHAALNLIICLSGVAGLYAMLAADFLFAVQLLVYV